MIIVTSNKGYVDIDGLACALAYRDLLRLQGQEAETVLVAEFTSSITPKIQNWELSYSNTVKYISTEFVLVDISDVKYFPNIVDQNNIIEIYDHHYGFEKFWKDRLGNKAVIEPIGACATLIWEQYCQRKLAEKISTLNANLLATAIVSNTLNFKANITNQRDLTAFRELQLYTDLEKDWIRKYFEDQEDEIFANVQKAIFKDVVVENFENLGTELVLGQIELWDGRRFIENYQNDITAALASYNNENWLLNCPSIEEGKTYFYTTSNKVQDILNKTLGIKFINNLAASDRLYLRKEVKQKLRQLNLN